MPTENTEGRQFRRQQNFVLGGLVTAGAGAIAKKFGPSVGGLFLAFPAILASATLVEKHERERKEEKGLGGKYRGIHAAGADAAGAAMGSTGLTAFAVLVWKLLPSHNSLFVIAIATVLGSRVYSSLDLLEKEYSAPRQNGDCRKRGASGE